MDLVLYFFGISNGIQTENDSSYRQKTQNFMLLPGSLKVLKKVRKSYRRISSFSDVALFPMFFVSNFFKTLFCAHFNKF